MSSLRSDSAHLRDLVEGMRRANLRAEMEYDIASGERFVHDMRDIREGAGSAISALLTIGGIGLLILFRKDIGTMLKSVLIYGGICVLVLFAAFVAYKIISSRSEV